MSTKFHEQRLRILKKNVSPDILFAMDMTVTCNQQSFLGNHRNKARLIFTLTDAFSDYGITCKQSQADADFLICNTAIKLAKGSDQQVILVGKDTDLLVMLIDRSCQNIYMQYTSNLVYSIESIRNSLPLGVRDNLLAVHAITGCDTVSAIYSVEKKSALKILDEQVRRELQAFKSVSATHDEVSRTGETFVLKIYKANETCVFLDVVWFTLFLRKMKKTKKSSFSSFQLESLPPT